MADNSNTVLWWVLGIIGTLITAGITACQYGGLF